MQLQIHYKENNPESESHLHENRKAFSAQCELILSLLKSGIKLTVKDAMLNYNISSLPRRILDIRNNGVKIKSTWIIKNGRRTVKYYHL